MAKTHIVMGDEMPVITDLPQGFVLVAHPNGPGISDKAGTMIASLSSLADDDLPETVRQKAVDEYVKLTWPGVKAALSR